MQIGALYLKDSHSNFEEKRVGNKVSLKVGREVIQNDNFTKCSNYYYYQHILKHSFLSFESNLLRLSAKIKLQRKVV